MSTEQQVAASTWTIDKAHSTVEFAVKHLMVATVRGRFREFEGTLRIDESDVSRSSVEATIDVASIDTSEADRDNHLRSADFFDAEEYPKMTFRSARVEPEGERHAKVYGELTIRDVTREAVLDVEFEGRVKDPWGNERTAFSASAAISREEFGMTWNQALEAGGWLVGDEVKINLHVEAIRGE